MMEGNIGRYGESLAASHLESRGYRLLARNYRIGRHGELDLVAYAEDGRTVCFIEVKTRSGTGFGTPAEAVTADKQRRIRRMAQMFLARMAEREPPVRFDVVEVSLERQTRTARVHHIPDAF